MTANGAGARNVTPWSKREDALLRKHYPHVRGKDVAAMLKRRPSSVYARAQLLGVKKDPETIRRLAREAIQNPEHAGRKHQFGKGHVPMNKGVKGWQAGGRAVLTQFKPGAAPSGKKPLGSVRLHDGVLYVKVADEGYLATDWKSLHSLVFELIHGPLPAEQIVIFADGNNRNFAEDNLICVSRAQNMKRNSIHTRLPPLLKNTVVLLGQLKRRIREKQNRGSAQSSVRNAGGAAGH